MAGDMNDTVKSVAEATKSVSDTTRRGIDVTDKACTWLARMMGEEAVGLLKDRIFYWRAVNALKLQEKLDNLLHQRQIENPKAIPLRLAIPFFEAATLEDDETLQERWARLLANAMDPAYRGAVERCFGKILEELSPFDCKVLECLAYVMTSDSDAHVNSLYLAELLMFSEKEVSISLGNLRRLELLHNGFLSSDTKRIRHALTDFGEAFLMACADQTIARTRR